MAMPPILSASFIRCRRVLGDRVVVRTLITSTPERLEGAGVKPADVEPSLREIVAKVTDKGPGGHMRSRDRSGDPRF